MDKLLSTVSVQDYRESATFLLCALQACPCPCWSKYVGITFSIRWKFVWEPSKSIPRKSLSNNQKLKNQLNSLNSRCLRTNRGLTTKEEMQPSLPKPKRKTMAVELFGELRRSRKKVTSAITRSSSFRRNNISSKMNRW